MPSSLITNTNRLSRSVKDLWQERGFRHSLPETACSFRLTSFLSILSFLGLFRASLSLLLNCVEFIDQRATTDSKFLRGMSAIAVAFFQGGKDRSPLDLRKPASGDSRICTGQSSNLRGASAPARSRRRGRAGMIVESRFAPHGHSRATGKQAGTGRPAEKAVTVAPANSVANRRANGTISSCRSESGGTISSMTLIR